MSLLEEKTLWGDKEYLCEYLNDIDFEKYAPITQVQALCIDENNRDEYVIFENINHEFGLPGGTVEKNEGLDETLMRELEEEAAVRPVSFGPLLIVKITDLSSMEVTYQARYWALVKKLDQEVNDPDGKSIRRVVVNREEIHQYVKWGKKLDVYLNKWDKAEIV